LSSKSPFQESLRRLKPDKHRKQLVLRDRSQLGFLGDVKRPLPKLLLDTTVYIDALQGTLPEKMEIALRSGSLWHSTVTEAELSAAAGVLDPAHRDTAGVLAQIAASIDLRPAHRTIVPDRDIWRDAGMLAGMIARVQHYGFGERRRILNDALIFMTAVKHGCAVLTRNISDFDLLQQLDPRGQVLFYERHTP
jgi:predicted nucleic acid-binding protein